MRKSGVLSTTIFLSVVLAGAYGILHDQVTASISEEYYTLLKFPQFRLNPEVPFRTGVSLIGFYATWWMGGLIGFVLGLIGYLLYPDHVSMRKALSRALLIVIGTALAFSIGGYCYGNFYLTGHDVSWWMPENLLDRNSYIITGSIHNSSYAGGLSGLLFAVIYLLRKVGVARKEQQSIPASCIPVRLHQPSETGN